MGWTGETRPRALFATAIVLTFACVDTALGDVCVPRWRTGEPIPGLAGGGGATAMTVFDDGSGPALYIGGMFWAAGSLRSGGLVRWDGRELGSVGGAAPGEIHAFTVHEGRLICAGSFYPMPGVAARNVAAWDGRSWSRLGPAYWNGRVRAVASYQGRLVAAGEFLRSGDGYEANHIAQWDGSQWSPLGEGLDGDVYALLAFGEDLIVGGDFTTAGGVPATNVARWDGTAWSALGSLPGGVRALASVDPDGSGPQPERIAAGGLLYSRWLATWSGTSWETLAGGPTSAVLSLLRTEDGLVAGGVFTSTQTLAASRIARWTASGGWSALGRGLDPDIAIGGMVDCVAEFQGDLYAGGWFHTNGDVAMHRVARWDGERWHALGPGLGGGDHVGVLAEHKGGVVVGGRFASVGTAIVANNIALRTGDGWEPLGAGLGRPGRDIVLAIETHEGTVHAAWQDASSSSEPGRLARWTGTGWESLGSGNREISALLSAGDDLYVGGGFTTLTDAHGRTTEASRVARFDGETFHALGTGLGDYGEVLALTMFRGNLVAAGWFSTADGEPLRGIARWDAGTWRPFGAGLPEVTDVAVHREALFASNADGVYRWANPEWTLVVDMTSEYSGIVYSLASAGRDLYFTGSFERADDVEAAGIARWDGSSTHPVGDGLAGGDGYALEAVPGKSIAAGGTFFLAGGQVSHLFARFEPCDTPAAESAEAVDDLLDHDTAGSPPAKLGVVASNEIGAEPVLRLTVPMSGSLTLTLHDVAGRRVGSAGDLAVEAGTRNVAWHELAGRFARPASGVYFIRAELRSAGGTETQVGRVVVVR
jgi:hypothetical protein